MTGVVKRFTVGAVLVTAALLSACGARDAAAPAGSVGSTARDDGVDDVFCAETGLQDVIAVASVHAMAGCEMAGNVIGEYAAEAPTHATGKGELVVQGWHCAEVPGPGRGDIVRCVDPEGVMPIHTIEPIRSEGAEPRAEVTCGPVHPEGGTDVDLVAIETESGTVGCEEAFTVIAEYYRDAPHRAAGQGQHDVRGWDCMPGSGVGTACTKDGFLFYTRDPR